jgi:hypothetical protein
MGSPDVPEPGPTGTDLSVEPTLLPSLALLLRRR